jgi:uncharacterized protein YndB with AHSA1/START domain
MSNKTIIIADPGLQEIRIIREFEAPPDVLFMAHTDPELFAQWLGPRKLTMKLEVFEPRSGGSWRYIHRDEAGTEYAFHGVYHEVTAPERIIGTFEFEGLAEKGHVSLETALFEPLPGNRTRLIAQALFQTVADRDSHIHAGMEEGVNDSYDRLDELLKKLQTK